MTYHFTIQADQEVYEYHGNTAIERTRRINGVVRRDWLFFDSAEDAEAFFNDHCACYEAA